LSDNKTITLNSTLKYKHLVFSETLPNGVHYQIAAAVGLLTRNVKLIGGEYPNQVDDKFGFKILVSGYFNVVNGPNGKIPSYYRGSAKISNVQMIHIGQFTGEDSAWMGVCMNALSFISLGPNNGTRTQYVVNNSISDGFVCGVGIDAIQQKNWTSMLPDTTSGLIFENNILFNLNVVPIIVKGHSNIIRNNLFVQTKSTQAFFIGYSGVVENNFLAGVGFGYSGDSCPYGQQFSSNLNSSIKNNIIHGSPLGVSLNGWDLMYREIDLDCLKISGFTVYKSSIYAIMYKGVSEVFIDSNILVDNQIGVYSYIFSPRSTTHVVGTKKTLIQNSLIGYLKKNNLF